MIWDYGGRNTYRMGKEGKYDLKLVSSQCNDARYFDVGDENTKGEIQTFLYLRIMSGCVHNVTANIIFIFSYFI